MLSSKGPAEDAYTPSRRSNSPIHLPARISYKTEGTVEGGIRVRQRRIRPGRDACILYSEQYATGDLYLNHTRPF
jgi:hypothetical protein